MVLLGLMGCSNDKESAPASSVPSDSTVSAIDTIATSVHGDDEEGKADPQAFTPTTYIGFVEDFYFVENNEVYVELYFKKDRVSYEVYKEVVGKGDSLIYGDDENQRTRIPLEVAQAHFEMRGIDFLRIYNEDNEFICMADFVRVEYLDQNVSPCFIAVFNTKIRLSAGTHYGIGNAKKDPEPLAFDVFKDSSLTQKLVKEFEISQEYIGGPFDALHFHVPNTENTVSIINSDTCTYIIHQNREISQICFKSKEQENFGEFLLIPTGKDQFPLILTVSFRPETDIIWNNILSFDGETYQTNDRQRVKWGE